MDHHVEDHVDVEAALWERTEAVHLDEFGLGHQPGCRPHGRIEALGVADTKRGRGRGRRCNQLVRLRQRSRERLFDERRDAILKKRPRNLEVGVRRHRHAHGIDFPEDVPRIVGSPGPQKRRALIRTTPVDVDDPLHLDIAQLGENAGMMPAHVAVPYDAHTQRCRVTHVVYGPRWRYRPHPPTLSPRLHRTPGSLPASTDSADAPATRIA